MPDASFAGIPDFFGEDNKQQGPFGGDERTVVSKLAGVTGGRIYRCGRDTVTWTIRGRLTRLTPGTLRAALERGIRYKDGQVYLFVDCQSGRHQFCRLVDYRQVTPIQRVRTGGNIAAYTVEIQATVEDMSPSEYT